MAERFDWSIHTEARIEDEAGRWLRTCHRIEPVRDEVRYRAVAIAIDAARDEALAKHLIAPVDVSVVQAIRIPRTGAKPA